MADDLAAVAPATIDSDDSQPAVLMVDDHPANLLVLREILAAPGQRLVEALSGEEALARIEADEFAVVLMDVLMPVMNGFEAAKRIRANSRTQHTPLIFLTAGDSNNAILDEAYALGAVDFITKPFSPVVLRAKVREFIELFQNQQRAKREAEQLRLLVQGTTDYAIFMLDPDGYIVTWNSGAERLKGYRADEIIGQHFSRFYPLDAIARGWPNYELEVARAMGRFEDEGWRLRKDGSRFWANVMITALRDQRGKLRGFSKVTRDMTERKDAEENARRLVAESTARQVAEENARAILEQRERLRVTLASIGDAVISTDAEGRVEFLNAVAQQLVGWTTEDAARRPLTEVFRIVNEQTRQPVENPAMRALSDGTIVGLANHTVLIAKDGTERPIDDSAAPIRDAAGNLFGSVLVFRDVSQYKRSEQYRSARLAVTQALNQAQTVEEAAADLLQSVGESLAWDAGFVWLVDADRNKLICRRSWCRPDAPVEEFETESCRRLFDKGEGLPGRVWFSEKPAWILDLAHDNNFPRLVAAANCGLASAVACPIVVGGQTLGVVEFFTRRRREVDDELLETIGTIAGGFGQFIERRSAVEELRRSEQELADFFENATIGLHWAGPGGIILRANQAELDMLGYRREEYIGRPIADFHADEAVICDILQRLESGEQLVDYPARLICKDGSIKDVLIDSSALFRDGRFIHTRCFTRDITERKRAEQALRDTDRRKDEFLATLAHELRNPLAPIRNSLHILKMQSGDSQAVERSREIMERQVQQLVRLVDDLLDVSRVMRGKIELRRERVELAAIVAHAVETVQPLIDSQQHQLTVSLLNESLPVQVDPVRLAQVISNLLANAAKYTEPNGQIQLASSRENGQAVLSVRDNGIGIAPSMLPHIFELFVQVDQAPARSHGGLGIGLTLVKNLVEMHGGTIEAHSEGLGKGSEFVVRLPLAERHESSSRGSNGFEQFEAAAPPTAAANAGRRLLVVDDNHDAANSLGMLLKLKGHHVRVAYDGAAALEAAAAHRPEVVFLDIGMPGMDGYEVARRIRQLPGLAHVTLTALTGWGQQQDRRRTAEAGFNHHLVKPPDSKTIDDLLAESNDRIDAV